MKETWYEDGLRFTCTNCGNCCTGLPGTVRVSNDEIASLAKHLRLSLNAFKGIYTRKMKGYTSLREKPNFDCTFWEKTKGCTVYEYRPRQCRTWPFWGANVDTQQHWETEAKACPGMNKGTWHSAEIITLTILDDGTSGKIP